ncbi:MAG: S1 RNA-binding domain-containing protein [Chloroflexi bacterium]|nr:S1 RNA-binding domain-containing protein [Chloroflexota bacterium]
MQTETALDQSVDEMDFASLLEESLAGSQIERGDIVSGTVLSIDSQGLIVDIGWKQDGIVTRNDIERMGMSTKDFQVNAEIDVAVVRLNDGDGNLILSASQARQNEDWKRAEAMMNSKELYAGVLADANRGGVIMTFGHLRGFIPASHVLDLPRGLKEEERLLQLQALIGKEISVRVIEVNRKRRRLVFSQLEAEQENRAARKQALLQELEEGSTREGVVSGLCDFGAFVDLGGADGLIHISELAWFRVRHPSQIVAVGDQVEVFVLHLDDEGKRIGLSLKRLQPNPWSLVDDMYHIGQLVEGVISRVESFGAFVSLDPGIEALLHVSQMSHNPEENPLRHLYEGQKLLMRIISIESEKQRLGLSLTEVTATELEQWEERQMELVAQARAAAEAEAEAERDEGGMPPTESDAEAGGEAESEATLKAEVGAER